MKKLLALLSVIVMVLVLAGTAAGDTRGGKPGGPGGCGHKCRIIKVQTRYDSWSVEKTFSVPPHGIEPPIPHYITVRATLGTFYYYWKDGSHVRITPYKADVCWSLVQGDSWWFDGLKANPRYRGDVHQNIVATIRVKDDGSRQNCHSRTILKKYRHWYNMGESPETTATGSIVLHLQPDKHITWVYGRGKVPYKYFHPLRDIVIEDWHPLVKAW